jgi:hypothetical protein
MFKEKKIVKTVLTIIFITGFFISVHSAANGRTYSLGQAFFVGDIILSSVQGWHMLGYPDQIQGSMKFLPTGEPGPVILIKSIGENFAMGATLNTFDRRTGGSVLASPNFLNAAINMTPEPSLFDRFPNYPQLHFGFKIGEQKFGIDGFFETQNYGRTRTSDLFDTASGIKTVTEYDLNTIVRNYGGQVSARFAFGNLAWNPWFKYGIPYLDGSMSDLSRSNTTIGSDTMTLGTKDMDFSMKGADRLITFGSCLDYTFGDWGWAIIGGWYRNETYQFKTETDDALTITDMSADSVLLSSNTSSSNISARYNNNYYDYFASVTPNIFDDLLIGFEYQGGFRVLHGKYENNSANDTTITAIYNDIIICLERPIETESLRWCDKLIPRGALRYSFGRGLEKVEFTDGRVEEYKGPISTQALGTVEGMLLFLGFGYQKSRMTVDFGMNIMSWDKYGVVQGPPPAVLTMTVDLHK